jgi:hypothetical protein
MNNGSRRIIGKWWIVRACLCCGVSGLYVLYGFLFADIQLPPEIQTLFLLFMVLLGVLGGLMVYVFLRVGYASQFLRECTPVSWQSDLMRAARSFDAAHILDAAGWSVVCASVVTSIVWLSIFGRTNILLLAQLFPAIVVILASRLASRHELRKRSGAAE